MIISQHFIQMKNQPMRPLILLFCLFISVQPGYTQPLSLHDDDRVVFIGDGLFENELDYGYLEYALTTAWPERHVTFRNIGWSGDTPAGVSRDHFTNPPTAYQHLIEQISAAKPTVAFVGYGAHMAFENESAIAGFLNDMNALLDSLERMDVRPILVSPAPHIPDVSPAPSAAAFNEQLGIVSKRIETLATSRSYPFVDLYGGLIDAAKDTRAPISDNGFQLNAYGYYLAGKLLDAQLEAGERLNEVSIDLKKNEHTPQVAGLKTSPNEVSFFLKPQHLPIPMPAKNYPSPPRFETVTHPLRVTGLQRGRYGIWVGNTKVATASSKDLARGITVPSPLSNQTQALQELIYKKNQTYFYQYRPQNETYLVGFREYEQGNNARELQLLDPLIGEMENEISRLSTPRDVLMRIVAE